jgi:thiol:disulfide interchange protein DsbD
VFSKPSLASAFAEGDVAFMVADWTTRDPAITAALAEFGASGVPLYVYYPPQGAPQVLPLPLSERDILKAVKG